MKKQLLFGAFLASSLSMAVSSQGQSFPNASFETWHNLTVNALTLEAPNNWHGTDSLITAIAPLAATAGYTIVPAKQLFQTSTSHSGQLAAEIRSVSIGSDIGNIPGVFSNAKIGIDIFGLITGGDISDPTSILEYLSYTEATPVTQRVDTVSAWVQLDNTNMDPALISILAVKTVPGSSGDSTAVVGAGEFAVQPGTNQYTKVSIPLVYMSTTIVPEKLIVVFASSDPASDTVHAGNKLLVDDIGFSYASGGTSIRQPLFAEQVALVYPNPASNTVYFNLNAQERAEDYTLTISDISGRVILQEKLKQQINDKNVKGWVKGTYFYNLSNARNGRSAQGKFIVE
jgi:hypothetical protein